MKKAHKKSTKINFVVRIFTKHEMKTMAVTPAELEVMEFFKDFKKENPKTPLLIHREVYEGEEYVFVISDNRKAVDKLMKAVSPFIIETVHEKFRAA